MEFSSYFLSGIPASGQLHISQACSQLANSLKCVALITYPAFVQEGCCVVVCCFFFLGLPPILYFVLDFCDNNERGGRFDQATDAVPPPPKKKQEPHLKVTMATLMLWECVRV